jgi:hypothetical protein
VDTFTSRLTRSVRSSVGVQRCSVVQMRSSRSTSWSPGLHPNIVPANYLVQLQKNKWRKRLSDIWTDFSRVALPARARCGLQRNRFSFIGRYREFAVFSSRYIRPVLIGDRVNCQPTNVGSLMECSRDAPLRSAVQGKTLMQVLVALLRPQPVQRYYATYGVALEGCPPTVLDVLRQAKLRQSQLPKRLWWNNLKPLPFSMSDSAMMHLSIS